MKMELTLLLCACFLPLCKTDTQTCDLNDMRALRVTVYQLQAELQKYKEETSALKKKLEHLKSFNSLFMNRTEALGYKLSEFVAQTYATNSTIQTRMDELNTSIYDVDHAFRLETIKLDKTILEIVTTLKDTLENNIADFEILGRLVNYTAQRTDNLMVVNDESAALINKVTENLQNHSGAIAELQNIRAISTNPVEFVAKSDRYNFSCNGTLTFEALVSNKGGVFNNNTGFFTAPYSATYMFTAQVCTPYRYSDVYFNIESPTRGVFSKSKGYQYCGSVTIIAYLSEGEQVSVNCTHQRAFYTMHINETYFWTMFSGAVLH